VTFPDSPRRLCLPLIFALAAAVRGSAFGSERLLSFEDRLACQEAIERVYYSHQIGATRPFEEAVPREVLERKVRTSLLQSVALEQYWKALSPRSLCSGSSTLARDLTRASLLPHSPFA
jgi:hypothetical protein